MFKMWAEKKKVVHKLQGGELQRRVVDELQRTVVDELQQKVENERQRL